MSILGQTKIKKGKHLPLVVCTQQRQHKETKIFPQTQQESVLFVCLFFLCKSPLKNTTFVLFYGLEASC